jgi:hypothetical protein
VLIVVGWVVLAAIIGAAAGSRGRSSVGWFVLAVLLSPLIAGLLLAILPDLHTRGLLESLARDSSAVDDAALERNIRAGLPRRTTGTGRALLVAEGLAAFLALRTGSSTAASSSNARPGERPALTRSRRILARACEGVGRR